MDVALYTLLPITIVMTILLRFLEAYGIVDRVMSLFGPLLKPFGLNGLSAVALLQTGLVSFAAPIPTLMQLERRNISDREIAATLAAVLAMAAYGVNTSENQLVSLICALAASSCCYYVFGRGLNDDSAGAAVCEGQLSTKAPALKIIEAGGAEAVATVLRLIPVLLLSLSIVNGIQGLGVFTAIQTLTQPIFTHTGLSPDIIIPSFVGYIAGSTALVGYYERIGRDALASSSLVGDAAVGFLVHNVNLVTTGILLSAGPKIARSTPPAIAAAFFGIALRVAIGFIV